MGLAPPTLACVALGHRPAPCGAAPTCAIPPRPPSSRHRSALLRSVLLRAAADLHSSAPSCSGLLLVTASLRCSALPSSRPPPICIALPLPALGYASPLLAYVAPPHSAPLPPCSSILACWFEVVVRTG